MFGEHDHDRIDPRIMFVAARHAFARPSAAIRPGGRSADRTIAVTAMPVGQAQRGGEDGRLSDVELGEKCEMSARVDWRGAVGKRGKARRFAIQPEEQRRFGRNRLPAKEAMLVNRRSAILPDQLGRIGLLAQGLDCRRAGAQMVGAVQSGAREKRIRRQGHPFGRASLRRRGDRALAGLPRRCGIVVATSPGHRAARRGP